MTNCTETLTIGVINSKAKDQPVPSAPDSSVQAGQTPLVTAEMLCHGEKVERDGDVRRRILIEAPPINILCVKFINGVAGPPLVLERKLRTCRFTATHFSV